MHNIQTKTLNPTIPTKNHAINNKNYWFAHLQFEIDANLMSIAASILSTMRELPQIQQTVFPPSSLTSTQKCPNFVIFFILIFVLCCTVSHHTQLSCHVIKFFLTYQVHTVRCYLI